MYRHPLRVRPALVAVLLLAVAGCSSGRPAAKASDPAATVAPDARPDAAVSSPAGSIPSTGLIVARCRQTAPQLRLTAYDPDTSKADKQLGVREFNLFETTGYIGCTAHPLAFRQQFDDSLSRVAVTVPGSSGGRNVGIAFSADQVSNGTQINTFTPQVQVPGNEYGAVVLNQTRPVYKPGSTQVWYYDERLRAFGWYDTNAPTVSHPASPKVVGDISKGPFYLLGDNMVVGRLHGPITPDGTTEVYLNVGRGYSAVPAGQEDNGASAMALPGNSPVTDCWPVEFIDANSFLCLGDGTDGSPEGMYKLTMDAAKKRLSAVALLPPTELRVLSWMISPDRTRLAVLSLNRTTHTVGLYVASLAGGTPPATPIKVADVESLGYVQDVALVAWR